MNFDRLNTFLVAAEDLNFTQAARRLHLSQPAVSQQIRELEESLGVSLFERRGRGLLLTPAGERLRGMALPIMRELKHVEVEMTSFQSIPQGVLRVGASNTPGIYMLPFALGSFSTRFPGVRVSMQVSDTDAVLRSLHEGELDLALVEEEPPVGRLHGWEKLPLIEDELVLIAPAEHPWVRQGGITLDQLTQYPFIFRTRQSETRRLIHERLAEAGLDPDTLNVPFELGNTEGLKRAVVAGLGVGFVSRFGITLEQKTGLLAPVPIKDFSISRTLWLVRPVSSRLVAHQETFCQMLTEDGWLPEEFAPLSAAATVSAR
jgi:DNA-binding transcriptional LysR family regulator